MDPGPWILDPGPCILNPKSSADSIEVFIEFQFRVPKLNSSSGQSSAFGVVLRSIGIWHCFTADLDN